MTPTSSERLQRLGNFLRLDPDNGTLLRDYAVEAWHAGEHRACAAALQRLRSRGELQAGDAAMLGRALRLDGQGAGAIDVLAEAVDAWPGEPQLALELAACHFAEHAFDSALEAVPELPAAHPQAGSAAAMRVRLLHHLGRLDEAVQAAEPFLAGDDRHPAVAAAAIQVLIDLSRVEEAQALAHALREAAPAGAAPPYEVFEPLAAAALDEDDPARAMQWLRQALAARQDDGRIWLLRGLAELRTGAQRDAAAALERAVDLMPSHPGSHLALGWAWLAGGDAAKAQAAFESGVEAGPAFAESHGSLAVLAAMQGRRNDALALVRKAQRLDRHCASARWAEQLLSGAVDAAQVSRLAAEVLAHARSQRQPPPDRRS